MDENSRPDMGSFLRRATEAADAAGDDKEFMRSEFSRVCAEHGFDISEEQLLQQEEMLEGLSSDQQLLLLIKEQADIIMHMTDEMSRLEGELVACRHILRTFMEDVILAAADGHHAFKAWGAKVKYELGLERPKDDEGAPYLHVEGG